MADDQERVYPSYRAMVARDAWRMRNPWAALLFGGAPTMLGQMLAELAIIDQWLDDYVAVEYSEQPLAQDWARISKVGEELGEAISEFISATGQNPRKPRTNDALPMLEELADTALTAILAMLHFTKNDALVGQLLIDKTRKIGVRMSEHKTKVSREGARNKPDAVAIQRAWQAAHIV